MPHLSRPSHWSAFIPLSLCLCMALDRGAGPQSSGGRVLLAVALGAIMAVGLPLIVGWIALDWKDRAPARVRT